MSAPAYACNATPVDRGTFYALACDPRRSVAVEACAGAGKTWMLVSRIVRALLDGTAPHEILAITFTRKAAGEMRSRLDEWLRGFALADETTRVNELLLRGMTPPQAQQHAPALAGLARQVLDHGRPVQIRTFHSWFASLLREAPMAEIERLGLPLQYELLEDDADAVAEALPRFFAALLDDAQARSDFEALVRQHGRHTTLAALQSVLSRRLEFELADGAGAVEGAVPAFGDIFPAWAFCADPREVLQSSAARSCWLDWARQLGAEQNITPRKAATAIEQALSDPDAARAFASVRAALFVTDEDRLKNALTRYPAAQAAELELQRLCKAVRQHEAWHHHQRMSRLMRLLLAQYAALKRERGWIDMADLERAALMLLRDPVVSGWIHERLDLRVRQLLIDEFQDTNPVQWQGLSAWLSGYAGAGQALPVFIVGDPKQSIYRFRRAEPQVFDAAKRFIVDALGGVVLSCDHTRRNAGAVLSTVNALMSDAARTDAYPGFRPHTTESAVPGQVLALPQVPRDTPPDDAASASNQPVWRDSLSQPRQTTEESLRLRECRQVAHWIAAECARGRKPADFMVLARQRERLDGMQQALRELHIPCERTERGELSDALEVQDIVALLDVLVSPTHNLSLAQVLRSPLFGVDESVLLRLADAQRQAGSDAPAWFDLLLADPGCVAPDGRVLAQVLQRWRGWVQTLPPHDTLSAIFHDADVLARYASAVPAARREAVLARLRGLLSATLAMDGGRYQTPYAWVRHLRAQAVRAPAVEPAAGVGQGAVSLLTVHGAKGLEAPVVILLDSDAPAPRGDTHGVCLDWPAEQASPRRFAFCAHLSAPPPSLDDLVAADAAAQAREELNVLYVAMTRAVEVLVFSSSQPFRAAPGSVWQRARAHVPLLPQLSGDAQVAMPVPSATEPFTLRVLPGDVPAGMPAAPSAVSARLPAATIATSRSDETDDRAARIGQAMHRLLEWADGPAMAWTPAHLRRVAADFALSPSDVSAAHEGAQRILQGEGAWAWDRSVLAWADSEVELTHDHQLLRIDRLVQRRDTGEWWVLDHKSAARPDRDDALRNQLLRYRDAVDGALRQQADARGLRFEARIRCAFLAGTGALIEIT